MTKKVLDFLTEYKDCFRLSALEEETGIPYSTLTKALRELPSRSLTEEQEKKLIMYFKKMKQQLEKYFI